MKILTILLPGIGNTLLFTPTLRSLKKHFPNSEITALVMYKGSQEILEGNPYVDKIIFYPFMKRGHIESLFFVLKQRFQNYDISILAYPANRFQYSLIGFLIGAKTKITHLYDHNKLFSASFFYSKKLPLDKNLHEVEENLNLLKLLNINALEEDKSIFLKLDKEHENFTSDFIKTNKLKGKKLVGIHAGSSVLSGMINKRWPKERFISLIDKLSNKNTICLLFGGNDEADLKEWIYKNTKNKPILVNTPSVKHSASLIKKCNLFISNDTALMHIAGALNTPTIILVGPVARKTLPQGDIHTAIFKNLPCQPCYRIGDTMKCVLNINYKCLKDITVDEVYNIAWKKLRV